MLTARAITDTFSVSGQLAPEDIAAAAKAGFTAIINNRPDGEAPGQMSSKDAEAAAAEHGLSYVHIPVRGGQWTFADIAATRAAIDDAASGKLLAYCGSGMRSAAMWALAGVSAGAITPAQAIEAAKHADVDLSGLSPALSQAAR